MKKRYCKDCDHYYAFKTGEGAECTRGHGSRMARNLACDEYKEISE